MTASARERRQSWSDPAAPRGSDLTATPTLYDLLGVSYSASLADITRAYREAMKRSHPDHQSTDRRIAADEYAKQLNAAYATLSKPTSRLAYDRTIQQSIVQDQIMSRYVGGFNTAGTGSQPNGREDRHVPTAAERREQVLSDRHALISLLIVFGGITGAVVATLLLWSIISALASAVF